MAMTQGLFGGSAGNLNSVPAPVKQTLSTNYIDFIAGSDSAGINDWRQQYLPELMEAEAEVFGNRTISGFLSQVGAEESLMSDQVVWSEQGRLHLNYSGQLKGTNGTLIDELPATHAIRVGDTIAIKDYDGNFGTNKLTIQRNGHKIQGVANDGQIGTNRASVVLVYIDSTKGWLYTNESNVADLQQATYIEATGGTILTSGDYKTHVFTGDGCFVVSSVGNAAGGPSIVDYLVVAGVY